MKMPSLQLVLSQSGTRTAHFRTACGSACGTAFVARGENETHYDVVDGRKLDGPITPRVTQIGNEVGSFEVHGVVSEQLDDGTSIVQACGFEFWVGPDLVEQPLELNSAVMLRVKNLTLYVRR